MPTLGTIYNPPISTGGFIGSGNGYANIGLTPGIYITSFSFPFNYTTGTLTGSYAMITIASGTATFPSTAMYFSGASASSTTFVTSGTFFVSVTANASLQANVNFTGISGVTQSAGTFWQAIRIA